MDLLPSQVEPVVQVGVIGQQLLHLRVGFVDILWVAGEGHPAEGADPPAKKRPQVSRDETGEVEGSHHPCLEGDLADVVAVVKRHGSRLPQFQHGPHVHGDGAPGRLDHRTGVLPAQARRLLQGPPFGEVAVERIVGAGLVGADVRDHAASRQFR